MKLGSLLCINLLNLYEKKKFPLTSSNSIASIVQSSQYYFLSTSILKILVANLQKRDDWTIEAFISHEIKGNFFFSYKSNTLVPRRRSRFKFFLKISTSDYGSEFGRGFGIGPGKNGAEVFASIIGPDLLLKSKIKIKKTMPNININTKKTMNNITDITDNTSDNTSTQHFDSTQTLSTQTLSTQEILAFCVALLVF